MPTRIFGLSWGAAVVILLMIIGGVLLIGLARIVEPDASKPDTNLIADQGKPSKLVLSGGTNIDGTPYVVFYLSRSYERSFEAKFSSNSYHGGQIKNVLVVDGTTATGQWLFEGTNQTIDVFETGWRGVGSEGIARRQVGLWVGVKEDGPDTPGSDARKKLTLAAFAFADRKIHTIATEVDDVRGVHRIEDGKMLIVYEASGKTIAATISTTDFSTLVSSTLPQLTIGPSQ